MHTTDTRTRWLTALAMAAVSTGLLAGCGSSGPKDNGESKKTGPVVAGDAANALEQSGALHAKGTMTESGKTSNLDLQLQGEDASGSIDIEGKSVQILGVGGKSFIKAPAAFWQSQGLPAAIAPRLDNRWVSVPASQSLSSQINIKSIADDLRNPKNGKIQDPVKTGEYNGQKVVTVSQQDGSTLDVAATGQPFPLRVQDKGTSPSDVALSGFGQRQNLVAPPDALDLSSLAG